MTIPLLDLRAEALGLPCSPRFVVVKADCNECGWKGRLEVPKGQTLLGWGRCPSCENAHCLFHHR